MTSSAWHEIILRLQSGHDHEILVCIQHCWENFIDDVCLSCFHVTDRPQKDQQNCWIFLSASSSEFSTLLLHKNRTHNYWRTRTIQTSVTAFTLPVVLVLWNSFLFTHAIFYDNKTLSSDKKFNFLMQSPLDMNYCNSPTKAVPYRKITQSPLSAK